MHRSILAPWSREPTLRARFQSDRHACDKHAGRLVGLTPFNFKALSAGKRFRMAVILAWGPCFLVAAVSCSADPPGGDGFFSATVSVWPVLHSIGGVVALDRSIYFNVHAVPGSTVDWRPADIAEFAGRYNAHLGRSFAVSARAATLAVQPGGDVEQALAASCRARPAKLNGWPAAQVCDHATT